MRRGIDRAVRGGLSDLRISAVPARAAIQGGLPGIKAADAAVDVFQGEAVHGCGIQADVHCLKCLKKLLRIGKIRHRTGIAASRGKVLIIADCDTTYDFLYMEALYKPLDEGICDMVIGNRYAGGIGQGAMPISHKLGVRFLSWCGRLRFHTDIYDFHCGLRGLTRKAAEQLTFHRNGMEFATEMIAEGVRHNLRLIQVPVTLRRCERERKSKLRTIPDGFRHLMYIIKKN